ncbi:unnamed protein product [Heterotrigona itama]|uniref:Uncharacterized protein n=1 Tax=Heterotrigona itama TaxID=395501 RepID=A0A6V7GV96_9HYME|nr:unnamed protein product [Heterotrigona itama]
MRQQWEKFDEIQLNIEELDPSEELRSYEMQVNYYTIVNRANQLVMSKQSKTSQAVTAPMAVMLPDLTSCIEALPATDANYAEMIELLKGKFDNARKTIMQHCNTILEMPKLTRDSPENLRHYQATPEGLEESW